MASKPLTRVMLDVEANGPAPRLGSMTELGVVVIEPPPRRYFYAHLACLPDAGSRLGASTTRHATRRGTIEYVFDPDRPTVGAGALLRATGIEPGIAMIEFRGWLQAINPDRGRIEAWSDNPGFDWGFLNWYLWRFLGENPLGHSCRDLGALYKGTVQNMRQNFKHLRTTPHTHDPVDDATGNVEAFLAIMAMWEKRKSHSGEPVP